MDIQTVLKKYKKVAIIGISDNPSRASHWIALDLKEKGYEVTGVNPQLPAVPGIPVVAGLEDLKGPLEIVNIYRSPDAIPALVDALIPLKPPVLWLQPGAQNPAAEEKARQAGMFVISGPCIHVETGG
jgi:uncharacterized protein